jgi:NitT/TauT family transport system substrate-binding protein
MSAIVRRRELIARIGAAALAAFPLRAPAQSFERIRVSSVVTEPITAVYYAIKAKQFERARLDVEIVPSSSGAASTTAVVAGTYEIAKPTLLSVCAAHLREVPIVVIAPGFVHTPAHPNSLLQIAADAQFKTGADLNERTIGVPSLNDMNSVAVRAWVERNGGDWKSLKFIETPNSALEEALVRHRIDAASLTTPALDASLAAGTTKSLGDALGAIAAIFMADAYVVRPDWAAAHADVVQRFRRVVETANGYVNTHLAETAPLVSELTKIELSNVARMNRSMLGTSLDPTLVQPLIDAAAKYGAISRTFPARELFWSPR